MRMPPSFRRTWSEPFRRMSRGKGMNCDSKAGRWTSNHVAVKRSERGNGKRRLVARAETQQRTTHAPFTRYVDRGDGSAALQTRTVRLKQKEEETWRLGGGKMEVDIVATVHIGDRGYYEELERELTSYDRVLYEMVADTSKIETRSGRFKPGNPKKSTSLVGMTQRGLASILKLEFQLEHLDYNAESWYHADLDIKDFDRLQKESGESLMSFSRSMSKSAFTTFWKKQKEVGGQPWERFLRHVQFFVPMPLIAQVLLSSLLSRVGSENPPKSSAFLDLMEFNISSALKRMLGKQLSLLGDASELASEGAASSVLIGARNAAAVEQVAEAAAAGCERVALLYGAAHSPDLERRLLEELGLYRVPLTDAGWVDAWNIAAPIADSEEQRSNTLRYVALLFISFVMATDLYLWESIVTRVSDVFSHL